MNKQNTNRKEAIAQWETPVILELDLNDAKGGSQPTGPDGTFGPAS